MPDDRTADDARRTRQNGVCVTLTGAVVVGELLGPAVPIASRYAVRWYSVVFALLVPTILLALADARLRAHR